MANQNENTSVVVLDETEKHGFSDASIYDLSEAFERDSRRYNRAFFEEQEVCVR